MMLPISARLWFAAAPSALPDQLRAKFTHVAAAAERQGEKRSGVVSSKPGLRIVFFRFNQRNKVSRFRNLLATTASNSTT